MDASINSTGARLRATTIGIQLAAHAAKSGIQQIDVARKTGYSPVTINRIFNGRFPAKSEILCAIAEAIGCEIKIIQKNKGMVIEEKIEAAKGGNIAEAKSLNIIMNGTQAFNYAEYDPYRKLDAITTSEDAVKFALFIERVLPELYKMAKQTPTVLC